VILIITQLGLRLGLGLGLVLVLIYGITTASGLLYIVNIERDYTIMLWSTFQVDLLAL